jgi:hypothetical protein
MFDGKALIQVISGSPHRAQAIGLPALRPVSVGFDPQAQQIHLGYETHSAVFLSAAHIGALLVSYCVRARIPMIRRADKDIRIEAGSVVIVFTTHFADALATW